MESEMCIFFPFLDSMISFGATTSRAFDRVEGAGKVDRATAADREGVVRIRSTHPLSDSGRPTSALLNGAYSDDTDLMVAEDWVIEERYGGGV